MGAFDAKRQDTIEIHGPEWDDHEFCTARTIVRSGDEEWVLNQQMLIQMPKGNRKQRRAAGAFQKQQDKDVEFKSQVGASKRLWVQKMLESWTFTMNGMEMPFEKSGQNELADKRMTKIMQALDTSYIDYIYEQIEAAQPKQASEDEQGDDEEEDEDEEEGSPFFGSASSSIDGEIDSLELTKLASMSSSTNTEKRNHRNFLSRS